LHTDKPLSLVLFLLITVIQSTSKKTTEEAQSSESYQTGESRQSGRSPGNDKKEEGTPGGERESKTVFGTGNALRSFAKELQETMMPLNNIRSYTKRYTGPVAEQSAGPYTGSTDISVVKRVETPWQKAWSSVNEKVCNFDCLHQVFGI
jgi:hypothetical protein